MPLCALTGSAAGRFTAEGWTRKHAARNLAALCIVVSFIWLRGQDLNL
jgi:hypothetical protein